MNTGMIIEKLAKEYPLSMAMSWDNPGLQVGHLDKPVQKVYVALDATEEIVEECAAWGADLLVTHHPLLMSGIRRVCSEDMLGKKILIMAEHGISHYAIHTNYDVVKMTELAEHALQLKATEVLEITGSYEDGRAFGIGCTGILPTEMTARECCEYVKQAFHLPSVRLFGNLEEKVQRIAVSPGSGKSMIAPALNAGVQLLITGDIGHHDGIDAVDQGLLVMDAGHYGVEHLFVAQMSDYLKEIFPNLEVKSAAVKHPFVVV